MLPLNVFANIGVRRLQTGVKLSRLRSDCCVKCQPNCNTKSERMKLVTRHVSALSHCRFHLMLVQMESIQKVVNTFSNTSFFLFCDADDSNKVCPATSNANVFHSLAQILQSDPGKIRMFVSELEKSTGIKLKYKLRDGVAKAKYCLKKGIPKQAILKNLWLLHFSRGTLYSRFSFLDLHANIKVSENTLPLLQINPSKMKAFVKKYSKSNKDYLNISIKLCELCFILRCSAVEAIVMTEKHPHLILHIEKVKKVIAVLTESGKTISEIRSHITVLLYSPEHIRNRLKRVQKAGYSDAPIWLLRRAEAEFEFRLARKIADDQTMRDVLGHNTDVVDYLANRLECARSEIELLASKRENLLTIKLLKLKSVLDFLFEIGFSPKQVRETPRVLCHSEKTIKKRYQELTVHGIPVDTLQYFYATNKEYQKMLKKYSKNVFKR